MAHALSNMHDDKCKGKPYVCKQMMPIAGPDLLFYIRNVSFVGKCSRTNFIVRPIECFHHRSMSYAANNYRFVHEGAALVIL